MAKGRRYKVQAFHESHERRKEKNLCEKLQLKYVGPTNRGEVKIILGINDKKEIVPMCAWISDSWKVIGNAIYRANNPDRLLAPVKVVNILVAYGEIALGIGL